MKYLAIVILSIILGTLVFVYVQPEASQPKEELGVRPVQTEERINGIIKRAQPYKGRDIKAHIKQSILNGERPNPIVETSNWQDVVTSYSELLDEYEFDQDVLENGIYLEIRKKAKERGEPVLPIKYE